jgi:hypothetical protein
MSTEDILQELERKPFIPLRIHLRSGETMDIVEEHAGWLRQNELIVVHPAR